MSFEVVLLEQLAALGKNSIVGGPFGSNLVSKDYVSSGVPVIRGQNMGARWVGGDFVFVSTEKAEALSPNKARPGDLVFTQRGTLGQASIVPASPFSEYIVSQSQMKLTVDPSKVDVHFLYYVFRSPEQLEEALGHSVVVAVATPAHAADQVMVAQESLPLVASELAALIRMNHDRRMRLAAP